MATKELKDKFLLRKGKLNIALQKIQSKFEEVQSDQVNKKQRIERLEQKITNIDEIIDRKIKEKLEGEKNEDNVSAIKRVNNRLDKFAKELACQIGTFNKLEEMVKDNNLTDIKKQVESLTKQIGEVQRRLNDLVEDDDENYDLSDIFNK